MGATTPNNQETEKAKFFESNFEYDPQFTYSNEAMAKKYINQFEIKEELYDISVQILESFVEYYGTESNYNEHMGNIISKEETEEYITNYLNELDLIDQIYVNFGT